MRDSFSNPSIRSEIFPATGFYAHLRTVENYISDNFKLINRYRILPLAHHNPRAPILSHKWLDNNDGGTQHNPSFYTQPDSFFKRNTDSSAYGLFEDNVAPESGKWPFAFSDYDVNSATIWTAFEIPTGEEYFTSVGNLMHANLTQSGMPSAINWGKQKNVKYEDSFTLTNMHPAYPIGNSMSSPYVGTGRIFRSNWPVPGGKNPVPHMGNLYDWSYLLNDVLWDSYFFSSYINTGSTLELNNTRYSFDESLNEDISHSSYSDEDAVKESYKSIASRLKINGSFNINSTSVEAWKAFLGGMLNVEIGGNTLSNRATFPRITDPINSAIEAKPGTTSAKTGSTYTGYNSISPDDIDQLAQSIVHEVRLRGPFVSLSQFVNRTVGGHAISTRDLPFFSSPKNSIYETAKEATTRTSAPYINRKGSLQAALDGSSKLFSSLNRGYFDTANTDYTYSEDELPTRPDVRNEKDYDALRGEALASHYTGYLTQGDLLARIGAVITPRSDTFKIRAYGDVRDPTTEAVTAKSWCEITVQRKAAYVDDQNFSFDSGRSNLTSNNQKFGRRFEIVSMRWLTVDEI